MNNSLDWHILTLIKKLYPSYLYNQIKSNDLIGNETFAAVVMMGFLGLFANHSCVLVSCVELAQQSRYGDCFYVE